MSLVNDYDIRDRILAKCVRDSAGCLVWQGSVHPKDGSPIIKIGKKQIRVRAYLLEHHQGFKIQKVHRCDANAACVLPEHCSSRAPSVSGAEKLKTFVEYQGKVMPDPCHFRPDYTDKNVYSKVLDGKRSMYSHRVIWIHANGPIEEGLQIDHLCCDKRCHKLEHLKKVSPKDNMRNAVKHGLLSGPKRPGEDHGNAKINFMQVAEIKSMHQQGITAIEIAKHIPVKIAHIRNILRGTTYGYVKSLNALTIKFQSAKEPTIQKAVEVHHVQVHNDYFIYARDNNDPEVQAKVNSYINRMNMKLKTGSVIWSHN